MIDDVCPSCEHRITRPDGHERRKQLMLYYCLACKAVIAMTWNGRLYFVEMRQFVELFVDLALIGEFEIEGAEGA